MFSLVAVVVDRVVVDDEHVVCVLLIRLMICGKLAADVVAESAESAE